MIDVQDRELAGRPGHEPLEKTPTTDSVLVELHVAPVISGGELEPDEEHPMELWRE